MQCPKGTHCLFNSTSTSFLICHIGLNNQGRAALAVNHPLRLADPLEVVVHQGNLGAMSCKKYRGCSAVANLSFPSVICNMSVSPSRRHCFQALGSLANLALSHSLTWHSGSSSGHDGDVAGKTKRSWGCHISSCSYALLIQITASKRQTWLVHIRKGHIARGRLAGSRPALEIPFGERTRPSWWLSGTYTLSNSVLMPWYGNICARSLLFFFSIHTDLLMKKRKQMYEKGKKKTILGSKISFLWLPGIC